jgi:hypothetical protein
MEKDPITLNIQEQTAAYETYCRPLTDAYPWNFTACYIGWTSGNLAVYFSLNQNGTFISAYLVCAANENRCFKFQASGQYFFNSNERKLTLSAASLELTSTWGSEGNEPIPTTAIRECVEKTFRTCVISNYMWGCNKLEFPCYVINRVNDKYDFENPVLSSFAMETYTDSLSAEINTFQNLAKAARNPNYFPFAITENVYFSGCYVNFDLDPNNTFIYQHREEVSYEYLNLFTCMGTWEYTTDRTLKLLITYYSIAENCDNYSPQQIAALNLPVVFEIRNFYFEYTSHIKFIKAVWSGENRPFRVEESLLYNNLPKK